MAFQEDDCLSYCELPHPLCAATSADSKSSIRFDLPAKAESKPLKRTIQIRTKPGSYLPGNNTHVMTGSGQGRKIGNWGKYLAHNLWMGIGVNI